MSRTSQALNAFTSATELSGEIPALQQAREIRTQNPQEEEARNR